MKTLPHERLAQHTHMSQDLPACLLMSAEAMVVQLRGVSKLHALHFANKQTAGQVMLCMLRACHPQHSAETSSQKDRTESFEQTQSKLTDLSTES